jgi:ribosome-binding protein aMBF1 (putative translation factor)
MKVVAKAPRTERVQVIIQGRRPRIFLVPKEKAHAVATMLSEFEDDDESVPIEDVLPALNDPVQGPATALRGARLKENQTQTELANRLGCPQSWISDMEHGRRPIGKKMAQRLAKALNIDYRVFL